MSGIRRYCHGIDDLNRAVVVGGFETRLTRRSIRAHLIEASKGTALRQQAGYTTAILSLSHSSKAFKQGLPIREEAIYGLAQRSQT